MVNSVISIINIPLLNSVKGGITGILDHTPTLQDKDINISKAKLEFAKSPIYSGNLISKDLKTTAIALNLKQDEKFNELVNERNLLSQKESNGTITKAERLKLEALAYEFKAYRDELRKSDHENLEAIKATIAKFNANDELFLGGANMIADDMIGFIKSDLLVYGLSVLALLSFSLWLFFRQIRWIVLPMFICAISSIFTTGIFGIFDWEVTVISSNYIALQLIITISTVIHLVVSYREFYAKHPKYSQNQLIYLTLRDKFSPSFWAIFTTVIGFSSLMSADIKPVIMLGIMMSTGISVSLVLAFLLFGAINVNLNKLAPIRTFENSFKFTKYCANLALNSRKIIYAVCVLVVCFGVYGISKIKVENSFIGYFKESTQIRQGMQVIDTKLGGTIPVDVIVKFKESEPKQEKSDEKDDFESEFENDAKSAKYWFNSYHTRVAEKVHDYLKEQKTIDAKAEITEIQIVEPQILSADLSITTNFEDVKNNLQAITEKYKGLVVTDQNQKDMEKTKPTDKEDDKPETVKRRLDVNIAQGQPIIDHYRAQGLVHDIQGNQEIEAVFSDIEKVETERFVKGLFKTEFIKCMLCLRTGEKKTVAIFPARNKVLERQWKTLSAFFAD